MADGNNILCKTTADSFDADEQENQEETRAFRAVTKDPYGTFVRESKQNYKLYDRWCR